MLKNKSAKKMAVGAFPIAKLGTLLVKQISKPIANALKQQAKNSPVFRKYVCLPPAQFYNWCEVKAKMWVLHLGKPVNIPVLSEKMAIELGANLLGEGIIFFVASALLIFEYNRSLRKEAAKEAAKLEEMEQLQNTIMDLFFQTEEQSAMIRELTRKVHDLETVMVKKPWAKTSKKDEPLPPTSTPPSPPVNDRTSFKETKVLVDLLPPVTHKLYPKEMKPNLSEENSQFLLRVLNEVEKEFWVDPDRQRNETLTTKALNHIYKDVYRINLRA